MRILQFRINGQKLSKDGDFSGLIAGTKGYLYTAYNFDGEWDGCKKAAVFSRYDKEYPVPIVNGKCAVPDEITEYKRWKVYLVGVKDGYSGGSKPMLPFINPREEFFESSFKYIRLDANNAVLPEGSSLTVYGLR